MSRFRSLRSEAGMTLVEVLITISILGLAIVGILSGLGSTSKASDVHRKQVTADLIVRSYGEAIKEKVRLGGYVNCATASTYNNAGIYTAPAGYVVAQDGVLYQESSALNVVLVLDVSSSIADANAVDALKNAGKAFVSALADTGTRVAIVTFGTRGQVVVPPTADTTADNGPAPGANNRDYMMSVIQGLTIPRSDGSEGTPQFTNWDEGLMKARSTFGAFPPGKPPLVVMVTDGNPNVWIDANGNLRGGPSHQWAATAVAEAKAQADAIEAAPTSGKVFAVGVATSPNINNLKAISGPNRYPDREFKDADWTVVQNFADLEVTLNQIALAASAETFTDQCPTPDQGAQLLTLRAATTDARHSETLQIVVRRR